MLCQIFILLLSVILYLLRIFCFCFLLRILNDQRTLVSLIGSVFEPWWTSLTVTEFPFSVSLGLFLYLIELGISLDFNYLYVFLPKSEDFKTWHNPFFCCLSLKKKYFGHAHEACGIFDQELNPCPLQWKGRVLTTGPPGKSLFLYLSFRII